MSPEKLGFIPVKTFVTIRSDIGVICATAEVNILEKSISAAISEVVVIVGIVRTVVFVLAVIVTEKLLFAGI